MHFQKLKASSNSSKGDITGVSFNSSSRKYNTHKKARNKEVLKTMLTLVSHQLCSLAASKVLIRDVVQHCFKKFEEKRKTNLTEHYKELYETSFRKIKNGDYGTDLLIDSPADRRFGVTLLIRPPEIIKNKIQVFLDDLKQADPSQYYYPNSDIHITVMSIISCYEGFRIDQILVNDYSNLIKQSLKGIDKFEIKFQGITASDSGIMIQGFPENEMLNNMRNNLRANFKNSNLEQSIDRRYTIQTAHATIIRFRKELQNIKTFLAEIEKYKNYGFGSFEVKEFELVFNDWYQREQNSLLLGKFKL